MHVLVHSFHCREILNSIVSAEVLLPLGHNHPNKSIHKPKKEKKGKRERETEKTSMAKLRIIFFLTCLVVTIPTFYANVLEDEQFWANQTKLFDKYWKQREQVAEKDNQEAYINDPYSFSRNITDNVTE